MKYSPGSGTSKTELRALLDLEPLRARVQRLRCFRGIDDLTALTIAAELGDPRRFATAPSTMAFVGLVPSEHSSGTKRAQGGITKTGNAHLRRVLVESAWHYRNPPFISATLRARQRGAPADVIARAWTAQQRAESRDGFIHQRQSAIIPFQRGAASAACAVSRMSPVRSTNVTAAPAPSNVMSSV
jgi:hypothetical protein